MANDYDKIFKENIENLIPFLARKVLGIEADILIELPPATHRIHLHTDDTD